MRAALATTMLVAAPCHADWRTPGAHPRGIELEPHLALAGGAAGPGVRASIPIIDPGFIRHKNDNVAISFGADWYAFGGHHCRYGRGRFLYACSAGRALVLPVTLQWNFFVDPEWSVFPELGVAFLLDDFEDGYAGGALYVGGRYHIDESSALTLRLGTPTTLSFGYSLYL
jgi:hypothetical protein